MKAMEYYAYWNGNQVRDLFEAIVAITSAPSYGTLIACVVLAGFIVTIVSALLRWQSGPAITFVFAGMLFYCVLFVPKVTVNIQDERAGQVYIVQNVPLGIGFFSSVTSRVGHFLTSGFEAAFALPDSEKFSKFGMVYPQRALAALQNAGAVTPSGRQQVSRFVADCVTPELIDYPEKANELASSSDIWQTVTASGWLNPARSSLQENGEVASCEQAAQNLDNYLNTTELDALKKRLGTLLNPDRIDPGAVIASSLPHAESLLLGLSRSLDSSLKHSVMLQAVPEGIASAAKQSGAPLQMAVNLAKAQGNLAAEINYRTMSEIAKESLPKIRNCVEFVIIAAFPLVLLLVLAAGSSAGMIFRSFFILLIWVQLWAPLFAVANYLLIAVDANPLNRIAAEYGGNSLMAVSMIRDMGASSQAIAGYLMVAIPMLALAIAKASDFAAVAMTGSLLAPAMNAAGSLAGTLSGGNFASGNLSTGNVSTNSVSGNKSDLSSGFADPYTSKTQTAYGSVTRSGESVVTGMTRTGIDLGVASSSSFSHGNTDTKSSATSAQLSSSLGSTFSVSRALSSSDRASREFMNALVNQLSNNSSYAENTSEQQTAGSSLSASTTNTGSNTVSTSQDFGINSGAGIRIGAGEAMKMTPSPEQVPNPGQQRPPCKAPGTPPAAGQANGSPDSSSPAGDTPLSGQAGQTPASMENAGATGGAMPKGVGRTANLPGNAPNQGGSASGQSGSPSTASGAKPLDVPSSAQSSATHANENDAVAVRPVDDYEQAFHPDQSLGTPPVTSAAAGIPLGSATPTASSFMAANHNGTAANGTKDALPAQGAANAGQAASAAGNAASPASGKTASGTVPGTGKAAPASPKDIIKSTAGEFGRGIAGYAALDTGMKVTTSQSVIDTASGADSSATMRQRAEAYTLVKSAAEQIAASATDSSVRSAARSFSASLDDAYQASQARSVQLNQSRNASNQNSTSTQGSDLTSVNRDVQAMNHLLSRGRAPEKALEENFLNPHSRDVLASQLAADSLDRAGSRDFIGAGQVKGRQFGTDSVIGKGQTRIRETEADNLGRIDEQAGSAFSEARSGFHRDADSSVDIETTRGRVRQTMESQEAGRGAQSDQATAEADLIRERSESYRERETGATTPMKIAATGTAFYTDPRGK